MILTYLMACATTVWVHRAPETLADSSLEFAKAKFNCYERSSFAGDRTWLISGDVFLGAIAHMQMFDLCMAAQGWVEVRESYFMDCITEFSDYDGCLVECSVN